MRRPAHARPGAAGPVTAPDQPRRARRQGGASVTGARADVRRPSPRSAHLDPVQGPGNRLLPAGVALLPPRLAPLGLPAAALLPVPPDLLEVPPVPDREARRVRRAQRRRLRDPRLG